MKHSNFQTECALPPAADPPGPVFGPVSGISLAFDGDG